MRNLTRRRRALAATAPMLMCVAALGGCGDDDGSSNSDSNGATDLQSQFVRVVERVSPQVVQIQTDRGLGSGIVYDDRGDIVTNAHVTGNARRFLVTLADGDRRDGTLVGSEPSNDLAVIRVSGDAPQSARFADSSTLKSEASSSLSATRSACSRASPRASSRHSTAG